MSLYKDLYIADGDLVTHELLNDLANNDQYLYEEMSAKGWGIQAWKQVTSNVSIATTNYFAAKKEIMSFDMTFDSTRTYRCNFQCGSITTAGVGFNRVVTAIYVGDTSVGGCISDTMVTGYTYQGFHWEWPFNVTTSGTQTVYCYTYLTNQGLSMTATINAGATKPIQCWIDDIGTLAVS